MFHSSRLCFSLPHSFWLMAILLLSGIGCVRTLQPILKDDQITTDASIVGKWVSTDGKSSFDVQPAGDDKTYKVAQTEENDKTGNFIVRLGKIDTLLVAEIHADDPGPGVSDVYKTHLLPVYSFVVVNQISPQLIVSALSFDWLKKHLRNNPLELAIASIHGDDFILTASTADIQAFLLKHYKDEGAMSGKATFVRPAAPVKP